MDFRELFEHSLAVTDQHIPLRKEDPIALAKRLGTYKQIDRSAQYQDASQPALLRSHNAQWAAFRRQKDIDNLKIWILGGVAASSFTVSMIMLAALLGKI